MKPGSGRKTRSLGDGRNAEPGPPRRTTRGRVGLHFRRDLPAEGKAPGWSCPPATPRPWPCISTKSRLPSLPEQCARSSGSGRLACLEEAAGSRQHHTHPFPAKVTRVEPGRKYLAVHARQLALEPSLQILRRHHRPLLRRLEQAHRSALENHVDRNKKMGISVVMSYNLELRPFLRSAHCTRPWRSR